MRRHRVVVGFSCGLLLLLQGGGRVFAADEPVPDDGAEDADANAAVMFAPLAIAFGVFGGEADVVAARSLAVSFDAAAYRLDGVTRATFGALGVGLLVYPLRPAFHGWYLEPRLAYTHLLSQARISGIGTVSASAVSGWQWTWDYGLSIRLGVGVAGLAAGTPVRTSDLSPGISPGISISTGGGGGGGRLALVGDAGVGWAW